MKNKTQPHARTDRGRRLAVFLLVPFLLFSLGAAVKQSAPSKDPAAQKARPKLKKVPWIWQGSTMKSYMLMFNNQSAELEDEKSALQERISQITGGISRSMVDPVTGKAFQTQPADARSTADALSGGVQSGAGQSIPKAQGGQVPAELIKKQAELRDVQSLLEQYKFAKQELQAATLGSEANYKALLEGRVKDSGGYYAKRALLDEEAKTEFVPDGPCGDYPADWCKAAPNARIYFGGSGFLNRQCVAYAAWKRWKNGQKFATGNAGTWPGSSPKPTVGSVAVWNIGTVGPYGHVAYVTAVGKDSITISEFNWRPFLHTNRVIKMNSSGRPSRFWN